MNCIVYACKYLFAVINIVLCCRQYHIWYFDFLFFQKITLSSVEFFLKLNGSISLDGAAKALEEFEWPNLPDLWGYRWPYSYW